MPSTTRVENGVPFISKDSLPGGKVNVLELFRMIFADEEKAGRPEPDNGEALRLAHERLKGVPKQQIRSRLNVNAIGTARRMHRREKAAREEATRRTVRVEMVNGHVEERKVVMSPKAAEKGSLMAQRLEAADLLLRLCSEPGQAERVLKAVAVLRGE